MPMQSLFSAATPAVAIRGVHLDLKACLRRTGRVCGEAAGRMAVCAACGRESRRRTT